MYKRQDCNRCRAKGLDVKRNCTGRIENRNFKHVTKTGLSFNKCPKYWLNHDARQAKEYIEDFAFFKKYGTLPDPGGRLDQTAGFINAVEIIENELEKLKPNGA